MHAPGTVPVAVQFVTIGMHCKRLAKKNAIVQPIVTAIIVHNIREKIWPQIILSNLSAVLSGEPVLMLLTSYKRRALPI